MFVQVPFTGKQTTLSHYLQKPKEKTVLFPATAQQGVSENAEVTASVGTKGLHSLIVGQVVVVH